MPKMIIDVSARGVTTAAQSMRRLAGDTSRVGTDAEVASGRVDAFGRNAERAGERTSIMKDGLSGFKGLLATTGATGLAFGLKDALQGGMKLQTQQDALQSALKATGETGSDAYRRLTDAAEKQSTTGGYSTEENIAALQQFVHHVRSVPAALQAMSVATDLARGKGISYSSAVNTVNSALAGNYRAVRKLVPEFVPVTTNMDNLTRRLGANRIAWEEQAKSMNKANPGSGTAWLRQMELQHGITDQARQQAENLDRQLSGQKALNLLTQQYAGQQARFARSPSGQYDSMVNAMENLRNNLGKGLLPELAVTSRALGAFARWLDKNHWAAYGMMGAVTLLAGGAGVKAMGGALKYATGPLKPLYEGLGKAASGIGKLASKVPDFVSGTNSAAKAMAAEKTAMDEAAAQTALFTESEDAAMISTDGLAASMGLLEIALGAVGILAFAAGVYLLVTHFHQVERAAEGAWKFVEHGAESAWNWIKGHWPLVGLLIAGPLGLAVAEGVTHFKTIEHAGETAFHGVIGAANSVWHFLRGLWTGMERDAGNALRWVENRFKSVFRTIEHDTPLGIFGQLAGGHVGGALHAASFGLFNQGGEVVQHHEVKHLYTGGPAGTDTVPAYLTAGEGVLTRAGMSMIGGEQGLSRINAGFAGGIGGRGQGITLEPGTVNTVIQIDGKTIAKAVTQYTLKKAARGPSSLVGGGLVTGVAGPSTGAA